MNNNNTQNSIKSSYKQINNNENYLLYNDEQDKDCNNNYLNYLLGVNESDEQVRDNNNNYLNYLEQTSDDKQTSDGEQISDGKQTSDSKLTSDCELMSNDEWVISDNKQIGNNDINDLLNNNVNNFNTKLDDFKHLDNTSKNMIDNKKSLDIEKVIQKKKQNEEDPIKRTFLYKHSDIYKSNKTADLNHQQDKTSINKVVELNLDEKLIEILENLKKKDQSIFNDCHESKNTILDET
ncbi:19429_t:CDS:2, partial [Racocetra fulgida]